MSSLTESTRIIHNARKLDADGLVDDFWLCTVGDHIHAVGTGRSWRHEPAGAEIIDAQGLWLTPGFIDLHSHGGGGHSFDDGPEEILAGLASHRAHGTTRSLISLVTNPLAQLREALAAIADLVLMDPLILGSHLEGPFLAMERRGAQNPQFLRSPDLTVIDDLITAGDGTLRQCTIAPELPGALETIDTLISDGIEVALGHTEANEAQAKAAFDHGARILSHTFNAMPGIHHRAPGPIIAAFLNEHVTLELILDGLHVASDVAAIAFREAPGRIALITDAMAAAGTDDGHYRLGSLNVTVSDGLAVLSGTSTIAGSTLTQDTALRIAVERVGVEPRRAVEALTLVPARALGLDHEFGLLRAGYVADTVLLDEKWQIQHVWAAGHPLV